MIPGLIDIGDPTPWPILPQGIYETTLAEVNDRFAMTPYRRKLFAGFQRATVALTVAGCRRIYLDGSFVTGKTHPNDYDACWDATGVDPFKLDPVFLSFANRRAEQKAKYQGEFFLATDKASFGFSYLDYFQREKLSGRPKGILSISLAVSSSTTGGVTR